MKKGVRSDFYCAGSYGVHPPGTQHFMMGRRKDDSVSLGTGDYETTWYCRVCGSKLWVFMEGKDYMEMTLLFGFFRLLELTEFIGRIK